MFVEVIQTELMIIIKNDVSDENQNKKGQNKP